MTPRRAAGRGLRTREIFRVPLLLALLSAIGLLSALLGDDIWDAVSWLGLGVPVAVIACYAMAPKSAAPNRAARTGCRGASYSERSPDGAR